MENLVKQIMRKRSKLVPSKWRERKRREVRDIEVADAEKPAASGAVLKENLAGLEKARRGLKD